MTDILKLSIILNLMVIPLVLNKFARRIFLNEETPEPFKVFLLSLPNLLEAIVGVMLLTIIGLLISGRWVTPRYQLNEHLIYLAAVGLSAIFVLTQEFNIYNRRGDNVYDPNDVLFSIIGLALSYVILLVLRPRIRQRA